MTQEEKARAYDEALEKGRIFRDHLLETGDKGIAGEIEYIFPALSQSEDEQIRKALIEMVHDTTGDELWVDYNVHKEDALAWLEKQCYTKKDVDDAYLKGISDAKNELEKQGEQKPDDEFISTISNFHKDVLLAKCLEAFNKELARIKVQLEAEQKPFDYEHATIIRKDFAPKVEPKKIEDEIEIPFGAKDSELQESTYFIPDGFHAEIDDDKVVIKKGEKSAAWSEEDENYLQSAENACEYQYGKNTSTILWLKSLKDRVQGKEEKK